MLLIPDFNCMRSFTSLSQVASLQESPHPHASLEDSLARIFAHIDTNKSGTVTKRELQRALVDQPRVFDILKLPASSLFGTSVEALLGSAITSPVVNVLEQPKRVLVDLIRRCRIGNVRGAAATSTHLRVPTVVIDINRST